MNWLKEEVATLDDKRLRRSLRKVEMTEKGRLTIEGKTYLNFSSNNYLGIARHPQVLEAVRQVLEHWGIGATSSRLISGSSVVHEDLERALAAFFGREAALVFPSGYMANLAVVTSLVGDGDAVVMDRLCHASLIDAVKLSGARLFVYAHRDLAAAESALQRTASYRRRLLISDSLFSMDGDFAPVKELLELCQRYSAMSLIDEAHAVGIWGEGGRGISSMVAPRQDPRGVTHPNLPDALVGTLSKTLGSQGGFVCGSQTLIDGLVNRARSFIYTTGLSPACVAGAQAGLSLMQEYPGAAKRVIAQSQRLRDGLKAQGFNTLGSESHIVPILIGEVDATLALAEKLLAAGIFAPAIRPPTVHAGECRLRFSVTAEHTDADIDSLLNALESLTSTPLPEGEGARRAGEANRE